MPIISYDDLITSFTSDINKKYILLTQEKLVDLVDTVYFGVLGATGITGPTGDSGPLGVTKIFTGAGDPTGVTGSSGNWFFSEDGNMYEHGETSWGSSKINMLESQSGPFSFRYTYTSGSTAPTAGQFSFNSDTATSVNTVYMSIPSNDWLADLGNPGSLIDVYKVNDYRTRVVMTMSGTTLSSVFTATLNNSYNNVGVFQEGDVCEISLQRATDTSEQTFVGISLPSASSYVHNDKAILQNGSLYTNLNGSSWTKNFNIFDVDVPDNGSVWGPVTIGASPSTGQFSLNSSTMGAITKIEVNYKDASNTDFTDFFATVLPGSKIAIRTRGDANQLFIGTIDTKTFSNFTYTFMVTPLVTSGALSYDYPEITFNK